MLHTLKAGILKDISVYLVLKKRIEKGKKTWDKRGITAH